MNFKKRVNGSWTDTPHYVHNTSTDTITTLPADIYPNDTTATVGLKGNMSQASGVSPDNPIQPQETGERTGNLLPSPPAETKTSNGITVSCDGTGRYYVTGTANGDADIRFSITNFVIPNSVGNGGNGTFSMFNTATYLNADVKIAFYNQGALADNWGLINKNRTSTSYTAMANKNIDTVGFTVKNGVTVDFQISPEFTDNGVLPTMFEPYGYKIPISSASTTTPIYLGEVETTRRIRELVLDGTENWQAAGETGHIHRLVLQGYARVQENIPISTHYKGIAPVDTIANIPNLCTALLISSSGNNYFYINDENRTSISAFKSYLAAQYAAGTPVTVWYVLATPETGVVNEPLRKIGEYADEVSGITIPVTAGGDTISVDTTLQPSEVTVNYKGWHSVQNVHERESGAWT